MTIKERLAELQESGAATPIAVQAAEEWLSSWMGPLDRGLTRAEETPRVSATDERAVQLEWEIEGRSLVVEVWGRTEKGNWDIRMTEAKRLQSEGHWVELWAWLWMAQEAQTPD